MKNLFLLFAATMIVIGCGKNKTGDQKQEIVASIDIGSTKEPISDVAITGNSPQPAPKWPVGGEQPSVNAGGDTSPLDMVATLTNDRKTLTIALINPTLSDKEITIQLNGIDTSKTITKWTLSAPSIMSSNIVGKEAEVVLKESRITNGEKLKVGAATINIYRYELQ